MIEIFWFGPDGLADAAGGLVPVHLRHAHVHHDQVEGLVEGGFVGELAVLHRDDLGWPAGLQHELHGLCG